MKFIIFSKIKLTWVKVSYCVKVGCNEELECQRSIWYQEKGQNSVYLVRSFHFNILDLENSRISKIASSASSCSYSYSYDVLANSANFDPILENFVAKMVRIQPEIQPWH